MGETAAGPEDEAMGYWSRVGYRESNIIFEWLRANFIMNVWLTIELNNSVCASEIGLTIRRPNLCQQQNSMQLVLDQLSFRSSPCMKYNFNTIEVCGNVVAIIVVMS